MGVSSQHHLGHPMRSCAKCRGSGKIAEENDFLESRDFYSDLYGVDFHRQSTPISMSVCPECKGLGILSSSRGGLKTRAEQAAFYQHADDWGEELLSDYRDLPEAGSRSHAPGAARTSVISKARALRRMTVANGATVHEAKSAAGKLQALTTKYGLTSDELDDV